MIEFLHHFENLVNEKKGKVISSQKSYEFEYHWAILPVERSIQTHDRINGGVAILWEDRKVKLRTFLYRQISNSGFIKPEKGRGLDFFPHELEGFVIELFSTIEALKAHKLKVSSQKFKEAKSGNNPLTLRMITKMVNKVVHRPDTLQLLSHYICEEDQRGLNPMAEYGRRIRRSQIVDRFDAANAVSAMARDCQDIPTVWKLMEIAGKILWNEAPLDGMDEHESIMNQLFKDRASFYAREE